MYHRFKLAYTYLMEFTSFEVLGRVLSASSYSNQISVLVSYRTYQGTLEPKQLEDQ